MILTMEHMEFMKRQGLSFVDPTIDDKLLIRISHLTIQFEGGCDKGR